MERSPTDPAGLDVSAEEFLAAVLEAIEQPIWVVDHEGVIRFANLAAIVELGYDRGEELLGRHSHETIHHSHPDGTPYPAADCPMLLPRVTGESVSRNLDWFFRRDGSMFPVSYVSAPIEMHDGRGAVVAFTDIEDRLRAEQMVREHEAALAAPQASLRRVATLVAGGAASEDVFAAIAREVAQVLDLQIVLILRYEPDGTATVLANWTDRPHRVETGSRWPLDGPSVSALVRQTGRPARLDEYADVRSTIGDAVRETGKTSGAAAPIVVDGEVWGSIATGPIDHGPLPDGIEDRLAEFTELVATAISNTQARGEVRRLAEEQAALRRVATLVARGVAPAEVFEAVAREAGQFLGVDAMHMGRYDDGAAISVAGWSRTGDHLPVGTRVELDGTNVASLVYQSGRPARIDGRSAATGPSADRLRHRMGVYSSVAVPIVVDGRLWGLMIASSKAHQPLAADTESRLLGFTELAEMAISNTEARSELAASRRRIVAASDDARRRIERDLHDGVQQQLVTLGLELGAMKADPPTGDALEEQLASATEDVRSVLDALVEIARGIHPAILSKGGLAAALRALARRSAVPVELQAEIEGPLPDEVEAAAYYVAAEALTNAAKHARASVVHMDVTTYDGTLTLMVRDDGVGGGDPGGGSGLVGLQDRVEALGGTIAIASPPGEGTSLRVELPLGGR